MQRELIEKIQAAKVEYDMNLSLVESRKNDIEEFQRKLKVVEYSQLICQQVAEETQSQLSVQLDSLVNLALETLFPGQFAFHLEFDTLRGKTEVKFVIKDLETGKIVEDILNAYGGGLVDICCFALRISLHSLGTTDKVIVLDEPFRFVSRNMRLKASHLLREVSQRLGLQFIMVTHVDELEDIADKAFVVKQVKGISSVEVQDRNEVL